MVYNVDLALSGSKFEVVWDSTNTKFQWDSEMVGLSLFGFYYCWCVVVLSIMMLRLLMAMMTNTFNLVVTASVRHWRVQFARCVLLVELVYSDPAVSATGPKRAERVCRVA